MHSPVSTQYRAVLKRAVVKDSVKRKEKKNQESDREKQTKTNVLYILWSASEWPSVFLSVWVYYGVV